MSGKRFESLIREQHNQVAMEGDRYITVQDMVDLLSRQAEDLEVLREWVNEIGRQTSLCDFQRHIIENRFKQFADTEIELAKRRIAALEGT